MPNDKKPIIVSNPKDPRLQDYKDSLNTYLAGEENLKKLLSAGFKKDGKDWNEKDWNNYLKKEKKNFRTELSFQKGHYYDKNPVQYTVPNPTKNTGYELKYLQLKDAPEDIILNKNRVYMNEPIKRVPLKTDAQFKYITGEYNRVKSTKTLNGKIVKDTGWQVTKDTRKTNIEDRDTKILLPQFKKPEQPYILKKNKVAYSKNVGNDITSKEYSNKHAPIYLTDKNDARIGFYSEAGNQYLYKDPIVKKQTPKPVDTRDKTIIKPLTPKQAKLNIETPKDTLKPLPITNTVVPEAAPKKLPGGSGKFARYPNMKKQLGSLETSRMVNARKVENIVPTFVSGAKSVKQYRGDENLPEAKKGMKNCGCKHPKTKYKYGTGAITIPEGSAIVTANGGKSKQAIAAYKKGNYKLLNKIIDDMPEDNVDKAQDGRKKLEARYKELGELTGPLSDAQQKEFDDVKAQLTQDEYDFYTDERIAEKFGQKYDVDRAKYRSSVRGGKLKLIEDTDNVNYRNRLRNEPAFFQQQLKEGKVTIDKDGNISYQPVGGHSKNAMEFLGTSKKGALPTLQGSEDLKKGPPPDEGDINKDTFATSKRGGDFLRNIPSLAEVAARASILGQGVEKVPKNYLSLGRFKYQSQLPKTLQEISLAEQGGRETARNMVGGDAGRYLAQAGSLSASRMKAANEAVIQDTLARQDILNRNVDLGNVEAQTNTGLKNQFAMQRAANRGAYNNMLVSLGQSIDTAADASKLMANQKEADEQRIQILKDSAASGNYQWKQDNNTLSLVPKKKGAKRLKTYKRK